MSSTARDRPPVRYWGRKAGESLHIINDLVKKIVKSSSGIALDPFAGAGSLGRELLRLGFKVVLADLNLYAWLIAKTSIGRVKEPQNFLNKLKNLRLNVKLKGGFTGKVHWSTILKVDCPNGPEPLRYRRCNRRQGICENVSIRGCKTLTSIEDDPVEEVLDEYPKLPLYYAPGIPYDKKRSVNRIDELFSKQMLAAMAAIARIARKWSLRGPVGSVVWLALAATAYPASRMQRASGGSWAVNSYWLPNEWLERNPILLIPGRIRKIIEYSMNTRICSSISYIPKMRWSNYNACVLWMNAKTLSQHAPRGFFDVLITDPPHFDEIQYYELSMFHVSWLLTGLKNPDVEKALRSYIEEVVVNKRRGISEKEYLSLLNETFSSLHRVLKPEATTIIILHEEEETRLERMLDSIGSAGFRFKEFMKATMPVKPIGQISKSSQRNKLVIAIGKRSL